VYLSVAHKYFVAYIQRTQTGVNSMTNSTGKQAIEENYMTERQQIESLKREMNAIITEIYDLMLESDGVSGLHLSGNLADWGWLMSNGRLAVYAQSIEETK
jgi:hypothetical protein